MFYLIWVNRNGARQWNGGYDTPWEARNAQRMLLDCHQPKIVKLHIELADRSEEVERPRSTVPEGYNDYFN